MIAAWEHATRLAMLRFEKAGKEFTLVELRAAKRAIISQAEAEAGEILWANADVLDRLAEELASRADDRGGSAGHCGEMRVRPWCLSWRTVTWARS